ncbi:YeeE/YedE family protein [Hyphococcus sp.]|uniref:YeeE/YedE family protein n=1 Tax=Hyphococcus sp. TaxID=2038636 RepID=UPI003D09E2FC
MENFTPVSAAIGGFLIGLSAVLFMALNGRIAGISGIVAGVLTPARGDWTWRLAFIAGLFVAPFAVWLFSSKPEVIFPHPLWLTVIGGLLVGFGARLGGGCTSGHGVCGMARLSKRSIAATLTFMASAIATVFIVNHLLGL